MTPQEPIVVTIPAHHTPHQSDPPDAHVFYAALGMLSMAWGRLEGHVNGNLVMITKFPEVAPPHKLFRWEDRRKLWGKAFSKVEALQLHTERAVALVNSIVESARDRNFAAHAIWDEFVTGAPEPTMNARMFRPRKGTIEVLNSPRPVSLSMVRDALSAANQHNLEMREFTVLLKSLLPPPTNVSGS
jgi:hypothetical protein